LGESGTPLMWALSESGTILSLFGVDRLENATNLER
jgi:hypothetical protein